jgi:hypothetical protein
MKKYSKLEMSNWIDEYNQDDNSVYMNNTINLSSYKFINDIKHTEVEKSQDLDDILHDIYIEIIKDLFNQLTPS